MVEHSGTMPALDDHLLNLALHTSAEPMLIVDQHLRVSWANRAAHQQPQTLHGTLLFEYLCTQPPASSYFQPELSQELTQQLASLPFGEVRWPRRDALGGASTSASVLLIRWQLLSEQPDRYHLITLQDRGRRRSDPGPAEQALKSQQAFINQLIHELRTPLAIAAGSLRRAVKRADQLPVATADHLLVARQELKRITRLIDHLSLLTDIDTASQRWKVGALPLGGVLEAWFNDLPDDWRRALTIVMPEGAEHHYLQADHEAIGLVLNNLVDNSLRYSPEGHPVVLLVNLQPRHIHFYLADWGYGIPPDLRDHVFDRFRRLEEHRDPSRADGSGLGLAVSRALLGLMNANISLLPIDPDQAGASAPSTVMKVCLSLLGPVNPEDQTPLSPALSAGSDPEAVDQLRDYLRAMGDLDPTRPQCWPCGHPGRCCVEPVEEPG